MMGVLIPSAPVCALGQLPLVSKGSLSPLYTRGAFGERIATPVCGLVRNDMRFPAASSKRHQSAPVWISKKDKEFLIVTDIDKPVNHCYTNCTRTASTVILRRDDMVHLDYRDARPIYTQIIDGFKEQISTGVLQSGDKLPSVRELAAELAINPNTIQRSYRILEVDGWIATVPGKGCFVCSSDCQERERQHWYRAFDDSTTALMALGVTRENLVHRIERGGNVNA